MKHGIQVVVRKVGIAQPVGIGDLVFLLVVKNKNVVLNFYMICIAVNHPLS